MLNTYIFQHGRDVGNKEFHFLFLLRTQFSRLIRVCYEVSGLLQRLFYWRTIATELWEDILENKQQEQTSVITLSVF